MSHALAMRMRATRQNKLILGLSGGLDSTLALLIAHRAVGLIGKDPAEAILTVTMPGPASGIITQLNAQRLAKQIGVPNKLISISKLVDAELLAIGHDSRTQDITYENIQARARTSLLFNLGNQQNAMVLGTGDLSELVLGWCTYNADQQSHYNINASVPKTLVKHLVLHEADKPEFAAAQKSLVEIVNQVISPELVREDDADISQSTEDKIGPYQLHEFFYSHLLRYGDRPAKIRYLAEQAFAGEYKPDEIAKWMGVLMTRFVRNQFKRNNLQDGPKIGSISVSPRGDWRMPADMPTTGPFAE